MTPSQPRIFTISPASTFLEVLAGKILEGFPLNGEASLSFADWTVLLPTRRAAREFTRIFVRMAGQKAILLPKVRAIGDLDEEPDSEFSTDGSRPVPISQNGLLFVLQNLISQWASKNPALALAQSINISASQSLGLALSLRSLIHQLDTQEVDLTNLSQAYDLELSEHREAILGLLELIHFELPLKLNQLQKTTFAIWRNQILRREAQRLNDQSTSKPIIAAGSTGTIPATRSLLLAIARQRMGAVVLPGLDQTLDDMSWQNLPPEHAQFAMKNMIEEFGIERGEVQRLGARDIRKEFLQGELLRPTETAELWNQSLPGNADILREATEAIRLVEARERHLEARSIALIMRRTLEASNDKTTALITPDRNLAARVKNELQRWNISIDDSAGQPLSKFGIASACHALGQAVLRNFEATSLFDFLRHPDVSNEFLSADKNSVLKIIEVTLLRNGGVGEGLAGISQALTRAKESKEKGERLHPLAAAIDEQSWKDMEKFLQFLIQILSPLENNNNSSFADCLTKFLAVLKNFSPAHETATPEDLAFFEIENQLREDSDYFPDCDMRGFLVNLLHILETTPYRSQVKTHPRLSILGTLEARLLPADIVILGGLNEGIWPGDPDPGPWLNRPMRRILDLAQPEREIGLAAHDFVQGLGYPEVYLTWSKRISGTPKNPSRWILRLRNLFSAAGLPDQHCEDVIWPQQAELLDEAVMQPLNKPRANPPVNSRPTRFSVTEIENLLRDPYGVYAKRVLSLVPLESLAEKSDSRLRGTLFHAAIANWTSQLNGSASSDSMWLLQEAGRKVMLPLMNDPEVAAFWMPAFGRMANWLSETDRHLRENVAQLFAEVAGQITFTAGSAQHALAARADRIDVLSNGTARIVDYKTGEVPTSAQVSAGFSPQLLLEAAILKTGGFKDIAPVSISELLYIKLSAGRVPGELQYTTYKQSAIDDKAMLELAALKGHLASYQALETAYLPRRAPKTEMQVMDYDHLSRFAEWILAEE
ncbi:MAG: double-strand break repair protein AddB [Aestuariivirga sp.]